MSEPRPIHPLLMAGLIALPLLFYWFLLRPGYAGSTRAAAAVYMLVLPLMRLVTELWPGSI